jgi:hypothetical protein
MSFDPRYYMADNNQFEPTTPAEKAFEQLDAEGVKWLFNRAMASEEEKVVADSFQTTTVPLFCKMYPAYVDSAHNMKLMKHQWETAFGVRVPNLVQLEESFFELRNSGVLTLNAKAVAKEEAAVIAQRHDELIAARKESEFDEADAYNMSLEELRQKANGF